MFEFIQKYYINPILYGTGYNIYNTITYAICFILGLYFVYKLLTKLQINVDGKFLLYVTPYVFLGGILRALRDAKVFETVILVTPLIYFFVFSIALSLLLLFRFVFREKQYLFFWFVVGIMLCAALLPFIKIVNTYALLTIPFFLSFSCFVVAFYAIYQRFGKLNFLITLAHTFDASTTFTALSFFSYFEQHVIPRFLISFLGPYAILIKIPLVIFVLWLVDKETTKNENGILKLAILVLGLAPGTRNFLRMLMGV